MEGEQLGADLDQGGSVHGSLEDLASAEDKEAVQETKEAEGDQGETPLIMWASFHWYPDFKSSSYVLDGCEEENSNGQANQETCLGPSRLETKPLHYRLRLIESVH